MSEELLMDHEEYLEMKERRRNARKKDKKSEQDVAIVIKKKAKNKKPKKSLRNFSIDTMEQDEYDDLY